jgi:preprotein translocase subunit SecY
MPYISASIFMQLMTILVPQMAKIQKEGESGRKKSTNGQGTSPFLLLLSRLQPISVT